MKYIRFLPILTLVFSIFAISGQSAKTLVSSDGKVTFEEYQDLNNTFVKSLSKHGPQKVFDVMFSVVSGSNGRPQSNNPTTIKKPKTLASFEKALIQLDALEEINSIIEIADQRISSATDLIGAVSDPVAVQAISEYMSALENVRNIAPEILVKPYLEGVDDSISEE